MIGILVTVEPPDPSKEDQTTYLAFVPDPRQINALSIRQGLFATQKANFVFVDGIPTQYGGTQDSELLGVVGLPATLASAYFTSIGQIFSAIGTSKSAQTNAISQNQALQLEQYKTSLCLKALASKNDSGIAKECAH